MVGIQDVSFQDKKVLIRVDFNVPITDQGVIIDDRRIRRSVPTIQKVIKDGGIAILLSHFGRPKHGYAARYSLSRLLPTLSSLLKQPIQFAPNCIGAAVQEQINTLAPGGILLLENVRFHAEETLEDKHFAQALAALADVYINEAFGTIHRKHVSTSLLPAYFKERYAGYLLQQEIAAIDKLFSKEQSPVVAIMGGNKLVDKAKPIEGLMRYVDHILIGGGLVLPFYHAKQARYLSYTEPEAIASRLFDALMCNSHCQLWLPTDALTAPEMHAQVAPSTLSLADMPCGANILDIGPATQARFSAWILEAKTILWAGPMGVFEWDQCAAGTVAIAQAIAQATQHGAYSIVGGGDTSAAIKQIGYENQVSYISTGGGALLAYIAADRKLPSLEALKE
ncbi:phosphoglycerate kinase [Cardinium endosymbiont of Oedothorax gibbosus]|uniref:phosphoglycerate kinase n=1 Tax=Cardinium endosymbiont of Oedothorax gibbosus TaxID=931101 RepID=UPI002025A4E4|nr:phosphoglycerate kinase [Cardinium endosymbiont of Oedothorax gibbosus]CAH2560183.1 Phosphoglycerate kinase [Cardinium endosymbiont of Oedothorax gibbosus]